VRRQPYALHLDRNAALPLDVHPVEVLRAVAAVVEYLGELQHPVRQGGLAVVDGADVASPRGRPRCAVTEGVVCSVP